MSRYPAKGVAGGRWPAPFFPFFVLLLMLVSGCGASAPDAAERSYRGAWFEVRYPASFRVQPSLPSSSADGYDSVFFHSPDGRVSFYVFAPQWGGKPADIALDEKRERLADRKISRGKKGTIEWYTIAARDGSYQRSYQRTTSADGMAQWIVGIRYASPADLERHRAAYERFKQSLRLYGD